MKKAEGELQYMVFVAVFLVMLSIIASIFKTPVVKTVHDETILGFFQSVWGSIWSVTGLDKIPIVNVLITLFQSTFTFLYVHPYLALVFGALVGLPLAYIGIRLVRGGG